MSTTTRLSDIFLADYYKELPQFVKPELSAFWKSGIVRTDPLFTDIAQNSQGTATLFGWNDLDPNEEPNASTSDPDQLADVGKLTQSSMRARVHYLNKGYGAADLTTELATSEPMQAIRNRFAVYWLRQYQRKLVSTARGIVQNNINKNGGDMVIDAGDNFSSDAIVDAVYTLGDRADSVAAMGVHSVVMAWMIKRNLIQYVRDADGTLLFRTYMEKPIFIDDSLMFDPKNGKYITALYANGAFAFGEGSPTVPVEVARSARAGNGGGTEELWERKSIILHPEGFSWTGDDAQERTPSNADIEKPTNWTRVFERKAVPMAFVINGIKQTAAGTGGNG